MKKTAFIGILAILFILPFQTGRAFVPPTADLFDLVVNRIKEPVGIRAIQTRKVIRDPETHGSAAEFNETLIYAFPARLRSEVKTDNGDRFYVESEAGFVKVVDQQAVAFEKSAMDHYTDVLLNRSPERLARQLETVGINTRKVSLRRHGGRVCFVVGQPGERKKPFPGLWIEKDSLLPVRYLIEKKGWLVEFRYKNWQRVSKTMYPMETAVYIDGQPAAEIKVRGLELASGLPEELFDVERISRMYPKAGDPESEGESDRDRRIDELDKQIEAFKNLYE